MTSLFPKITCYLEKHILKDISQIVCIYGIEFLFRKEQLIISNPSLMMKDIDISGLFYDRVLLANSNIRKVLIKEGFTDFEPTLCFRINIANNFVPLEELDEGSIEYLVQSLSSSRAIIKGVKCNNLFLSESVKYKSPSKKDNGDYVLILNLQNTGCEVGIINNRLIHTTDERVLNFKKCRGIQRHIFQYIFSKCRKMKLDFSLQIEFDLVCNFYMSQNILKNISKNLSYIFPFMTYMPPINTDEGISYRGIYFYGKKDNLNDLKL
jgi:hypothetical protein